MEETKSSACSMLSFMTQSGMEESERMPGRHLGIGSDTQEGLAKNRIAT
jgi:hypothetical protein